MSLAHAQRALGAFLAAALFLAACSAPSQAVPIPTSAPTLAAPTPAPTSTPAAPPTPTLTPYPTATPAPTPTPIPAAVLRASEVEQQAYAGIELQFQISGLKPLERATLYLAGPNGGLERLGAQRADRQGAISWNRDSSQDPVGPWSVHVQGELGTRLVIGYLLKELPLPTESEVQGETRYLVYRTPRATFYFEPGIQTAAVRRIADLSALAAKLIPPLLDYPFDETIDFFLVSTPEALQREIIAGGAEAGAGHEAGISLYGFKRSGIYIDMSTAAPTLPHVVAHEMSHQIAARAEANRDIPHWLEEGLAEYFGNTVAMSLEPGQELSWRRQTRSAARNAALKDTWVDLSSLGKPATWFFEKDYVRASLYYAEGYTTVDFVAKQYGDAALKLLFQQMADSPEDVEGVVQRLFGISLQDFQAGVRSSVLQLDDHEVQVQALIDYAGAMFRITDDEGLLNQDWNRYLSERRVLRQQDRIARVQDFLTRYRELVRRTRALVAPPVASEPHGLYVDALETLTKAIEIILTYERTGASSSLTEANSAIEQGNFYLAAAQDRLTATLSTQQVRLTEVLPGRTR